MKKGYVAPVLVTIERKRVDGEGLVFYVRSDIFNENRDLEIEFVVGGLFHLGNRKTKYPSL